MVKFSDTIMSKNFTATKSKDAFLSACRWIAVNVLSNSELARNITFEYENVTKESGLPTWKVTLLVSLDEREVRNVHCKICKEMHKSFFINENCNCSWCNASAYQRRMDETINTKKLHYASILKKAVDNDD